ncbi:hypothetical protein BGX26_005432, partial [Mortierella sp. AD094]
SFGCSLTLEDLNPPRYHSPNGGSEGDLRKATTPTNSEPLLDASLLSSDPNDLSFHSNQDLCKSTSKMYSWNYLEGNGRHDSNVDSTWIHKDIEVGRDLMSARNRAVLENGGLTEPYEKLSVNFVFLVESDHQTRGLHAEVEDESWDALCEATRDEVEPLPKDVVDEALAWVHLLAQESPDSFRTRLRQSPPKDPTLQSILNLMETRNEDSDLLVPDFASTTKARHRDLSIVLLEGKVASNTTFQIWDDKTKLGQEMRLALDSILLLEPEYDVQVVGILVREPLVEFYTMRIHAEGTYIMRRFAACYIAADPMNMLPIIAMMGAFQHALTKVEKTVAAIRHVKVRSSANPKVPLSWLRPCFKKPKLRPIVDGQ